MFGEIERLAPGNAVVRLIESSISVQLFGLKACPINSTDKSPLKFNLTRSLIKLFHTSSIDVIKGSRIILDDKLAQLMCGIKRTNAARNSVRANRVMSAPFVDTALCDLCHAVLVLF
jgi:hypothetical protein